ncbi:MAG: GNAT family N-acetyltransferase [Phycisphaerales bacterium]
MDARQHTDPESYELAARSFLLRSPLLNQMPLGIAESARTTPSRYPQGFRGLTIHDTAGACVGAYLQTPPHPVLISHADEITACTMAQHARTLCADATVVFGQEDSARAFAHEWGAAAGRVMEEVGLFELTEVVPVGVAAGACRVASPADAPLLLRWMREFSAEALPHDPPPDARAGDRLAASERCWIWETADGTPVCFVNNSRRIAGFWSIGPVYTPREHRGHGYASSLVQHVSLAALASGASGCTLFTDLANPTSNRIYQRIGYQRIGTFAKLSLV